MDRFHGINFSDGTNQIVSSRWLMEPEKTSTICFYPRGKSEDIENMCRQHDDIGRNWTKYKCKNLCNASV